MRTQLHMTQVTEKAIRYDTSNCESNLDMTQVTEKNN